MAKETPGARIEVTLKGRKKLARVISEDVKDMDHAEKILRAIAARGYIETSGGMLTLYPLHQIKQARIYELVTQA